MDTPVKTALADLRGRVATLMLRDERRLARRLDGARRIRDPKRRAAVMDEIAAEVAAAEGRLGRRKAAIPALTYPAELPVSQRREEIAAAIRDHPVVIVAGETGSGKTTQLPKICLELGRGVRGVVGHTQPRRIAARTVADRIAEELGTEPGTTIGYKMRFTDQVRDDTLVKLMTDGILLAELAGDRALRQYDTLIIDEAHERSLNIDFILGYLKQLLPRRPDLKVIITSATIDPERFAEHFGGAPIIEVSGRTYPVEVRYRPYGLDDDRDQTQAVLDAVDELALDGPGDVLVFLSGEREIRDVADVLRRQNRSDTEILPMYARLSTGEQHRVFQPHRGRRIVLATNVAETSLTVPGIRYVVDPGTARISRYSQRLKVQRLPIEPISQASANQRAGRCGRTSDGVCIRLYDEDDFAARPEFTDPEILRTNLASVILQMTALGLGELTDFPFIDPPDRRHVRDGVSLLHELGAIDPEQPDPRKRLTRLGRQLAQLPIDPRLGRMILEADRNGCAREVLIIAAALAIQDPRERPTDQEQAARQQHARFKDERSDFVAYLNLWRYLRDQQKALSGNQFRKLCRAEFLNYLRVREWQDLFAQLRQAAKQLGVTVNSTPADPDRIHRALLAGLLSHIGMRADATKDGPRHEYLGARGARFAIFPGSHLFKARPPWVMAAELVETSRLWARIVAQIDPAWAEDLAGHLIKRTYSEPHWEKNAGAVMAYETVTLYGLPVVAGRKVAYGKIDPDLSRELFIRHALVDGDWRTQHEFFHGNRRLLASVEDLEHRARRRDILVGDEELFDFYDARIPPEVVSAAHFDSWWKKVRRSQPDLLDFDPDMLVRDEADTVSTGDYPDSWSAGAVSLRLTYQFEPGTEADGVTVHIPLDVLNQVEPAGFEWQVPGLREELVTALIKSLPKQLRRNFVPAPDHAAAVLRRIDAADGSLLAALERELQSMTGVLVPREAWDVDRVPEHLRMTFRVEDGKGRPLSESKDLDELKRRLATRTRAALASVATDIEQRGLTDWSFGELPRSVEGHRGNRDVKGCPALVDEGESVAVRITDTQAEQRRAMWTGTRRLLLLTIPAPNAFVSGWLSNESKLALSQNPHGSVAALLEDCVGCAVDKLMADGGGPVWDADGFAKLRDVVRADLVDVTLDVLGTVEQILTGVRGIEERIKGTSSLALVPALTDIRAQLANLIYPGFVTASGWSRLPDLVRYIRAIERRLDKLPTTHNRDRELMDQVHLLHAEYDAAVHRLPHERRRDDDVVHVRWMLEELRVSFFAQSLGTAFPVSGKRILRAIDQLST
ncbi:MAG TPA: ATP-dependent RNA helicase HrpA [Jiangellaceae bacterium]|nr:ATP-dependent RNA helicase HrpA [Jiangellaceae bacterium]